MSIHVRPRTAVFTLSCSLLIAGCYTSGEGFARRVAKHECTWLEECAKAAFEDEYGGNMKTCREDGEQFHLEQVEDAEASGCDYDPAEGRACGRSAYRNRHNCDLDDYDAEWEAACDKVFVCGGGRDATELGLIRSASGLALESEVEASSAVRTKTSVQTH